VVSSREQIIYQIRQWLSDETKQQNWIIKFNDADPVYYCTFRLVNKDNIMYCIICLEKDFDRVVIMNELTFSKPDEINYKLTLEKASFWIDLRINLIQLGIGIQPIPDVENMNRLRLHKLIYFDGWSRDNFMHSVYTIMDATEMTDLLFKKFTIDINEKMKDN
jgi:hypothetical protein